ncbi:alpha/beta-hydrolase [Hypoxylon crocopeplum]|nr:alpha/beta-hydrolase [Hypoxylon crocopeplum]
MAPDARPAPRYWAMGAAAFERRMPHHAGVRALWESKWREPCRRSVYPFHDGCFDDFEPVFQDLIARDINDGTAAEYTLAFLPPAKSLERAGDEAAAKGDVKTASKLYLRACCMLRVARFPYITGFPRPSDTIKWEAWEQQKQIYRKAGELWSPSPLTEVLIPHTSATGRDRATIPVYIRAPPGAGSQHPPCPAVILLTGLDGYRPDNTARSDEFLARGWAAVIFEIPGTADCPADPTACSTAGGYYAVRAAHTHRESLVGVVAHGAGTHHFFSKEWLARADGHEYPFRLTPALAAKHGYGDNVAAYLEGAQGKFSLLETGILELPSTRLLLVNGTHDGLMPIEDSMLLFEYGSPKEARFFTGALHMGYPMANSSVYPWMEQVMASAK